MKHLLLATIAAVVMVGCGKGYKLEYGKPAAQFLVKYVAAKVMDYKKLTIDRFLFALACFQKGLLSHLSF